MPLSICMRNKRNKLIKNIKNQVQLRKQIFLSTRHVTQDTWVLLNDCLIFGKFQPSVAIKVLLIKVLLIKVLLIKVLLIKVLLIKVLLIKVLLIKVLLIKVLLIKKACKWKLEANIKKRKIMIFKRAIIT